MALSFLASARSRFSAPVFLFSISCSTNAMFSAKAARVSGLRLLFIHLTALVAAFATRSRSLRALVSSEVSVMENFLDSVKSSLDSAASTASASPTSGYASI